MEIQTTIRAFSEKIGVLEIPPETPVTVIIETFRGTRDGDERKPRLPFLHSGAWDEPEYPADISENTDYSLYGSEDIHDR